MDINDKLQKFSSSLENTVNKEYEKIESAINEEIKNSITQEIAKYEEKKRLIYERNIQKIEKEYNKKVFKYEIQNKQEIINEEKRLTNELKKEAIDRLKKFITTEKYFDILDRTINERII